MSQVKSSKRSSDQSRNCQHDQYKEKIKERNSGNCTATRQNGLRIILYPNRLYVPHTANNKQPSRTRKKAPAVATRASGRLSCGLKVCGMAKRSYLDRSSSESIQTLAGNSKARALVMQAFLMRAQLLTSRFQLTPTVCRQSSLQSSARNRRLPPGIAIFQPLSIPGNSQR